MTLDRVRAFFAEDDAAARRRHGRFEIVRELGRGGSGTVYEAVDPGMKRRLALKVLTGGSLERLRREAEAAARLRHPNVVTIFEVGADYLAMELVEGRPGVPDLKALLVVARAVDHAHAKGVVHRDLKPANVMVAKDGRLVLTDFGLARIEGGEALTRTGAVAGTPVYMAPEQVRGEISRIGPATDVWALGVMLYELAAGRLPFEGSTPAAVYEGILKDEPKPIDGPLGAITARALDKDPTRRYPDAGAFADDLERHLTGMPVVARSPGLLKRWARRLKRNPLPAVAGAALVLALAGASVLKLWMLERDRAVAAFRGQAKTALEAAIELRRAGANSRMRPFLESLERAYGALQGRGAAEVEYYMGRMHRALNDDERALEFQERALAVDPNFAPARYERGLLRIRRALSRAQVEGGFEVESLLPLVQDDLHGARSFGLSAAEDETVQGFLLLGEGKSGAARDIFRKLLEADPLLEEAREGLAWGLRAEAQAMAGRKEAAWAEAEATYAKGLERDKGYVPHYLARGQLRWSRGSARRHRGLDPSTDYAAAEADFAKAVELAPLHVDAWTWRGEMKVYEGIYALEMGSDPRPRLDAAEVDFDHALKLNPRWARAWMWRGNGRFYRALWLRERGLEAKADLEAAVRDLTEAITRAQDPKHELRWRGRARAYLGAALAGAEAQAVWAAGEEDFRKGEEADPWHYTWWAALEQERGDLAAAEQLLGRALALNPGFDEALKLRGQVRFAKGDWAAAASDLHQALVVNPNFRRAIGDLLDRARRKASE